MEREPGRSPDEDLEVAAPPLRDSSPTLTRDLLARYLCGDHEAERSLFDRHRALLLRKARGHRLLRPIARQVLAEDIVQEVFWRALSSGMLRGFEDRGRGSLAAALTLVLERTLMDAGRRLSAQKRGGDLAQRVSSDLSAAPSPACSRDPTPTSCARESELLELCRRELSPREWEVFERVELGGATREEVAASLGESAAAVRGLLFRARGKLSRALGRGGGPNAAC